MATWLDVKAAQEAAQAAGLDIPHVTSERIAETEPRAGRIVFNTDTDQWIGWNNELEMVIFTTEDL